MPVTLPTPVIKFSTPTRQQVINSVERIVAVFLVAAYGTWTLNGHKFDRASVVTATITGAAAVYQLVKSYLTTL